MLYKQYIQEREGKDIIEHEHGFMVYELVISQDKESFDYLYIHDVFVVPEERNRGIISSLEQQVLRIAEANLCKNIYCQCDLSQNNPEVALLTILRRGYKIASIKDHIITFIKEIL